MLPIDAPWPMGGEIDIMERLNHDTIAYQTIHTNYTHNLGIKDNPLSHSVGAINPDDYNVYSVEMYPDSIAFYINDTHTSPIPASKQTKKGSFLSTSLSIY